jgi:uncharacterized protein YodC (DUF2158 family)
MAREAVGAVVGIASKFKVGDVVRLRGGDSPSMTVKKLTSVNMKREYTTALCVWFDRTHVLHENDFPMTLLEEVPR